jgi:hypothetical protein
MDAARQRVEQAMHGIAEQLYKAQAADAAEAEGAADPSASGGAAADDDVIDAEYTEEKGDA